MDPLSITASVVGLTATCLRAMKAMNDLKGKFQNANLTIIAICTETLIISTSLSQIQSSMLGSPDELSSKLSKRPDLKATLDHALIGCYVVFDVLQAEIQKLAASAQLSLSDLGLKAKLRYLWNEKMMQDILQQIRGLQTALTLLLQLLGTNDLAELKKILKKNTLILSKIVQRTSHFRTVKSSSIPESVFDLSFDTQRINRDDSLSMISSTFFSFDDEIVNSHTYRRALTKAYAMGDNINGSQSQSAVRKRGAGSTAADEALGSTLDPIVDEWLDPTIEKTRSLAITKIPIASPKSSTSSSTSNTNQTLTENIARSLEVNEKDLRCVNQTDIDYQIILCEILSEERNYLKELENLIHDLSILSSVSDARREKLRLWGLNMNHLMSLFNTCEQIYQANQEYLYDPLNLHEFSEGALLTAILDSFQNWLKKSGGLYVQYAYHSPHVNSLMLRMEQHSIMSKMSRINHAWLYYLCRPLRRIESYDLYLRRILEISESSNGNYEVGGIKQLFDKLKRHVESCCLIILPISKNSLKQYEYKEKHLLPSDTNIIYKKWMSYSVSHVWWDVMILVVKKPSKALFILKETHSGFDDGEKELEVWDELRGDIQPCISSQFKTDLIRVDISEIVDKGKTKLHFFYLKSRDSAVEFHRAIELISEGAESQDSL